MKCLPLVLAPLSYTLQFHTCGPRARPDVGFRTPPRGCGISRPTLQIHTCGPRAWPDVGFRTPPRGCGISHPTLQIHTCGPRARQDVGFRTPPRAKWDFAPTLQIHTCGPRAWQDVGFRTPPRGCGISHPRGPRAWPDVGFRTPPREVGFGVMSTTAGLVFPAAAGDCLNKKTERSSTSAQCRKKGAGLAALERGISHARGEGRCSHRQAFVFQSPQRKDACCAISISMYQCTASWLIDIKLLE